ncbi:hypothetical protein [Phenylobacterium sp.]|uniref:hypothetical protein n=1 Tax=Phenylobacterium sp. TaxID=1871053 RepID=UPI003961F84A
MIELTPAQASALRSLIDAGSAGLLLSAVGVGNACRLAAFEFATISKDQPQRVHATRAGRARIYRTAT